MWEKCESSVFLCERKLLHSSSNDILDAASVPHTPAEFNRINNHYLLHILGKHFTVQFIPNTVKLKVF